MHAAILQQALSNWSAGLLSHSARRKDSDQGRKLDEEQMICFQLRMIKNMRLAL